MMDSAPDHGDVCREVREFLASGADRALSGGMEEMLLRHLEGCDGCRRIREEHREVWDLLGKASLPAPIASDAEFLAATRSRIRREAAWKGVAALAAAALLLGLGLTWFLPRGVDQAVIENMTVLEDLQGGHGAGEPAEVGEIGIELLTMLEEESSGAPGGDAVEDERWDADVIDLLLDDGGKKG